MLLNLPPAKERIRVEFVGRPLAIEISTSKSAGCFRHFGPQQSSFPEGIARHLFDPSDARAADYRSHLVYAANRREDVGTSDGLGRTCKKEAALLLGGLFLC